MSNDALVLRRAKEAIRHLADPAPPWHEILQGARDVLGADSASFIVFEGNRIVDGQTLTVDTAAEREYFAHFHTMDILRSPEVPWPPGTWFDTETSVPARMRSQNEYYNDFMLRHGIKQMVSFLVEDNHRSAGLTIQRASPTSIDVSSSAAVIEFTRSLQEGINARKAAAQTVRTAMASIDDALGEATFLVTREGEVIHPSPRAAALLEGASTVSVRNGRLWHASPKVRQRLLEELHRAALAPGSIRVILPAKGGGGCVLDLGRADGRLGYARNHLLLARLRPSQTKSMISAGVFCAAMDITPTEGEVLAEIVNGATPEEIASAHKVSVHTVRKHIALLMEKAGCTRQVDLVRIALGSSMGHRR